MGGPPDQRSFVNSVLTCQSGDSAASVLEGLQRIEQQMGRLPGERWGPRAIDLDLILCNSQVIGTTELTVPHPRWAVRQFVIQPAAEVASSWADPVLGVTVAQLRDHWLAAPRRFTALGFDRSVLDGWFAGVVQRVGGTCDAGSTMSTLEGLEEWVPRSDPSSSVQPGGVEWAERRGDPAKSAQPADRPRLSSQWAGPGLPHAVFVPHAWYPEAPAAEFPAEWAHVPRVPLSWNPVEEIAAAVLASDPASVRRVVA
jgi:7,8-dihydro-6-hydroxymethylpterin-pyrophosphokinase